MGAWLVLMVLPMAAQASGGRSLPSGGEQPMVVESVFESPRGEVQFTQGGGGYSAFLRSRRGGLTGLLEVRGHSACDAWLVSNKSESLPGGCEFRFRDDFDGAEVSVRSEEMVAGSLFDTVKGAMRGRAPHVAL